MPNPTYGVSCLTTGLPQSVFTLSIYFVVRSFAILPRRRGAHFEKVLRKDEKMSHQSFWQRDKNGLEIFEALNFNFEMFREDKTGERECECKC